MRKRTKVKKGKKTCQICKGQKHGWACRWKARELAELKEFEKLKQ